MYHLGHLLTKYGAVGCAVLAVAAIELAIHGPLANMASIFSVDSQIPVVARHLIAARLDADLVFLGDSSVGAGLDPVYFGQLTGLTAVNLGTIGNMTMAGFYFLLTEYLASNPSPRYVVLGCVYNLWPRDLETTGVSQTLAKYFPTRLGTLMLDGFWPVSKAPEALLLLALPSVRYRFDMQRLLTWYVGAPSSSSKDELQAARETNEAYLARREAALGFSSSERVLQDSILADLRINVSSVRKQPAFSSSVLNMHYLGEICSLGARRGFQVLFQPMPLDERLLSTAAGAERLRGYASFLEQVDAGYPSMGLLADSIPFLPSTAFSNTIDHLNRQAAAAFTAEVAASVVRWGTSRSTPSP